MHVNAFPDPDLTDQFDLTVRRPPTRLTVLWLLWLNFDQAAAVIGSR